MGQYLAIRNGGKTDENAALRFLRQISSNGQGVAQSGHMQVSQHSTPNTTVDLAVGDLAISYQDYIYWCWIDAIYNLAIASNSSGSNRIDAVVAYIDLTVVSSASNNNPGALKFMSVAGTPSGSPVPPNNTAIQSAVGAGNPFYILANVAVANGFPTSPSTIVNANITDKRTPYIIGSAAKYLFFIPGSQAVANNVSINPQAPTAQTLLSISAYAQTAPAGSDAAFQVYNITKGLAVGSVTISAGSNYAITSSLGNPSINARDVLRADVIAQASGTPAANITLEAY